MKQVCRPVLVFTETTFYLCCLMKGLFHIDCRSLAKGFCMLAMVWAMSFHMVCAQTPKSAYQTYIERYAPIAVEQMERYGIPASITLAQGLLESAAGQSSLARKANNHFGIKVGMNWTGPYVLKDDDYKDERFRKYRSAEESYEDHSVFLRSGQRYASLFKLKPTDYKGWAHGLKSAGYATNPHYAQQLIHLIESYDLASYDNPNAARKKHGHGYAADIASGYTFGSCNGVQYLLAREGDTYKSIAKMLGSKARKLRKYNDAPKQAILHAGDIVYLHSKKSKASKKLGIKTHVVKSGESLYAISQSYGIRLKSLYKLNQFDASHVLHVGDTIRIR